MKSIKDLDFWSSLVIIFVTLYLMIATYLRWFQLHVLVGPFFIDHWFVWIGTLYIAFSIPVFYVSKRRHPKRLTTLIRIHAFGNLFAFMLISIHFAQQIGRPPQFYPDLGTGLTLYIVVFILKALKSLLNGTSNIINQIENPDLVHFLLFLIACTDSAYYEVSRHDQLMDVYGGISRRIKKRDILGISLLESIEYLVKLNKSLKFFLVISLLILVTSENKG